MKNGKWHSYFLLFIFTHKTSSVLKIYIINSNLLLNWLVKMKWGYNLVVFHLKKIYIYERFHTVNSCNEHYPKRGSTQISWNETSICKTLTFRVFPFLQKKTIHHSNFPSSYSLSCLSDFFRYLGLYKLHWETASVVELKTD